MKALMKHFLFLTVLVAAGTAHASIDPATIQQLLGGGMSVSVSWDTAVIGSPDNNYGKGSAYVFTRTDGVWSQQARLIANDGTANDSFGYSLSLFGDTALIWADGDDSYKGSTYIFTLAADGTWSQQQKLTQPDYNYTTLFGIALSISGDTAVIGANGSAYVFGSTDQDGVVEKQQVMS